MVCYWFPCALDSVAGPISLENHDGRGQLRDTTYADML